MQKIQLTEATKKHLSEKLGIPFEDIVKKSASEIDDLITAKTGRKLKPQFQKVPYLINRGSVFLFLGRIFSINIKRIDRIIAKI